MCRRRIAAAVCVLVFRLRVQGPSRPSVRIYHTTTRLVLLERESQRGALRIDYVLNRGVPQVGRAITSRKSSATTIIPPSLARFRCPITSRLNATLFVTSRSINAFTLITRLQIEQGEDFSLSSRFPFLPLHPKALLSVGNCSPS